MAQVTVSDYALWIKHIHGDDSLRRHLDDLPPEATVVLRVAGKEGVWRKMSAYRTSGRKTPGLSPLGPAQSLWKSLYAKHKREGGAVVEIELVSNSRRSPADATDERAVASTWERAPEVERQAAWEAFKALRKAGWRSEGPYGTRAEWYAEDDR